MKLLLVRHGETEENYLGKIQGRNNVFLNDTGRRQVKRLKDRINNIDINRCFISPLIRCFETALVLVGDRVEIVRDDRLIQREMGELTGRDVVEYNAYQFWDYDKNRSDYGVEAIHDLFERCSSFIDYLYDNYSDDTILVVTHGEVFRALRYLLNGKKISGKLLDGEIDFCKLEEFSYRK